MASNITDSGADPALLSLILSLDHAKAYLGIAHSGEDALIEALIAAAIARIETYSGCALLQRVFTTRWHGWPGAVFEAGVVLPIGPVQKLESVLIVEPGVPDADVTDSFQLCGDRVRLLHGYVLAPLMAGQDVSVSYRAGLVSPDDEMASSALPADVRQALLTLCAHMYAQRISGDGSDGIAPDVLAVFRARRGVRL